MKKSIVKSFYFFIGVVILSGFSFNVIYVEDSPKVLLSILPQNIDGQFDFVVENISNTPVKIPSVFTFPSNVKITTPDGNTRSFSIHVNRGTPIILLPKDKKVWSVDIFLKLLDSGISEVGKYELNWSLHLHEKGESFNFQSNNAVFFLKRNNQGLAYNDLSLTFKENKRNRSIIANLKNNRNRKLITSEFNSDYNYIKITTPSGEEIINKKPICCPLRIMELSPKEEKFWEITIDSLFSIENISPAWRSMFREKGEYQLQWYILEITNRGHMGREFYSEPITINR